MADKPKMSGPRRKDKSLGIFIPEDAPDAVKRAYRTELSINDIRASAWNAVQGNDESYRTLRDINRKLAKIANSRIYALKKENLDMFAYDRAVTYLANRNLKQFPMTLQRDYKTMVTQLSELTLFINQYTSTVSGARYAMDRKIKALSEATGHEYTEKQKYNLGRLLGTDSVSALLRDVRGDSTDVIEILEELSLKDIKEEYRESINEVVDTYLAGWNPFDAFSWQEKSHGMTYDEMMRQLRAIGENT